MAIKPPPALDDRLLGGSFLRGLTAHMLLETVTQLQPGQVVLIHAAAGGLGLVLSQWAKSKGVITLGTVSSQEKAELATRYGLDHPVLYRQEDFVEATLALTGGRGADLVIDGIGGDTLAASLRAVRPFGLVASIGQIAARPEAIDPALLVNRALIRPSIVTLLADRHAYRQAATAWFDMVSAGFDQPDGVDYPFAAAAIAHADLEQGLTCGPVRLIV